MRGQTKELSSASQGNTNKGSADFPPHTHSSVCLEKHGPSPVRQQSTAATLPDTILKSSYPDKLILNKGKDQANLTVPSSREKTTASTCAKVETDSYIIPLLANFFAVTMKALCLCYKYGLLFAEYVLRFIVEGLLILLVCTQRASCLPSPPEEQNPLP